MSRHRKTHSARAVVATPWWIRTAIYVLVAIAGLVATATGWVTPEMADGWQTHVPGIAAMIGGLVAALHTGRASDESPASEVAEILARHTPPEPDEPARPALPVLDAPTTAA